MLRIISVLLLAVSSTLAVAQVAARPPELAPGAPDRHVVERGDTLWGIAAKFLKEPYRWPEVWKMNKAQVKNPHRIYPGQAIVLDRSGGSPRLLLQDVKLTPKEYIEYPKGEIASIPLDAIQPFLSQPRVLDDDAIANWPRIVETQAHRSIVGAGDKIYAKGVTRDKGLVWRIFRPGKPLVSPSGEQLGVEGVYLGTARMIAEGSPATLQITTSALEIASDDLLQPEEPPGFVNFVPRAPDKKVSGNIISVYRGVGSAGKNSVVSISLGKRDGIEVGHVLALSLAGRNVDTRYREIKEAWSIPEERNGLVFVFQVFDRVSYALVVDTKNPVADGDAVKTP